MNDRSCIKFLQWALPCLHMRWQGFRKVRRQVCRRIDKRLAALNLTTADNYREYLNAHPEEWQILDHMCRITISRFYRDRDVYDYLATEVLPALLSHPDKAVNANTLRVWSAGCASGEEAYTVALLWHFRIRPFYPDLRLKILATDIDSDVLRRAEQGCYPESSIQDLPAEWLDRGFIDRNGSYCLHESIKGYVRFSLLDIRANCPEGAFHIVLCRNLAFTYFDQPMQDQILCKIGEATQSRGILIIGKHETIVDREQIFTPLKASLPIFQKR